MKIGDRICEARRRAGMNQKTLAALAGIYQPKLSNYERNLITPTARVVVRIADALNVPVESLITDKTKRWIL